MGQSPVSAISRIRPARSLPIPFHARRPASSRPDTCSAAWPTMSAPLRYARILNGLSPFSSSRSAISDSVRATARLSSGEGRAVLIRW